MTGDIPVIWHNIIRDISRIFHAKRVVYHEMFVYHVVSEFFTMEGNAEDTLATRKESSKTIVVSSLSQRVRSYIYG